MAQYRANAQMRNQVLILENLLLLKAPYTKTALVLLNDIPITGNTKKTVPVSCQNYPARRSFIQVSLSMTNLKANGRSLPFWQMPTANLFPIKVMVAGL